MAKNYRMCRITFKRYSEFKDDSGFILDRLLVGNSELFKMLEIIMTTYPESVSCGNFIKIEEVVF